MGLFLQRHDMVVGNGLHTLCKTHGLQARQSHIGPDKRNSVKGDLVISDSLIQDGKIFPATSIDVKVLNPTSISYISKAVQDPVELLREKEMEKDKKHREAEEAAGRHFVPFIITTGGMLGPRAKKFIETLSMNVPKPSFVTSRMVEREMTLKILKSLYIGNSRMICQGLRNIRK